jgi:3-deoxy-D-manno-octulosonate 8-phosphate phosphatase (KDO 8-P phosphatase)
LPSSGPRGAGGAAVEIARRVKLVVLDVDGVLTDGGLYIGSTADGTPVELKRFEITDQLGIKMLGWAGLEVVMVSGRASAASRLRAEEMGIACLEGPGGHKLAIVERLLADRGLDWQEVACVSDDLADMPILRRVGLAVAVANAVAEVRAVAHRVTTREGGRGAVREFAESLLRERGEWNALVERYCRERERAPV